MGEVVANRFLKPDVLMRLGSLELVARTVVDGVLTGLHRSPHFGFSQEFAEFSAYNEGDDLRFVDWNVYARSERMYIKRFRGETNTSVSLLLDASASMGFGEPNSKLDQARFLVASLAYLTRKQHDSLGLTVFDDSIREYFPPSAKPDCLMRVLGMLEHTQAGQSTDLENVLHSLQANLAKRGLVILVSDFYIEADKLIDALRPLAHVGQDIALFHVLDSAELEPTIKKISALRDLETNVSTVVDPGYLQHGYRNAIQAHCESIADACVHMGADYIRLLTTDPLDDALRRYLQFRARRSR